MATQQEIEDCIALFCLENMDFSQERTDTPQQREDFVGTWDYYDGTNTDHDTLYFTADENGNASTYYLGENTASSENLSTGSAAIILTVILVLKRKNKYKPYK